MTFNSLLSKSSKRRRIMIITADEDIIDQIEKNNDTSALAQMVLESGTVYNKSADQQVIYNLYAEREHSVLLDKATTIRTKE